MTNHSATIRIFQPLFVAVLLFCLPSCAAYKIDTKCYGDAYPLPLTSKASGQICNQIASLNHPIYSYVPRHRDQIQWYDVGHWGAWLLVGNDDDGLFGEGAHAHYKIDMAPSLWKALAWGCRNPLHNFSFYVIGSAHRENSEFALIKFSKKKCAFLSYKPGAGSVFPDKGTSFFLGFHGWKPFISLRMLYNNTYETIFYAGWRERGNFGLKFFPLAKRKSAKAAE